MKKINIVLSVFFALVLLMAPFAYYALYHPYHKKVLSGLDVFSVPGNEEAIDNVAAYFGNDAELDQAVFTEQEILHLADVKFLIDVFKYMFMLVILVTTVLTIFEVSTVKAVSLAWTALIGSVISLGTALLKILFYSFAFGPVFNLFHRIFFFNDLWLFDSSSLIIGLFPQQFFQTIAISSVVTTLILSLVVAAVSGTFLYHTHENERKSWGKLWRVY